MKENWLFIKTPDYYGEPEIIEFDSEVINHFHVKESEDYNLVKIVNKNWNEKLSEVKFIFVNPNRVRFVRNGKIHRVLSENESTTEDCIFKSDYEKLNETETELSENKIESLKFEFNWNGEKLCVRFNEIIDSQIIQEVNKRLNIEGTRIKLQRLDKTLFLSVYTDIYHDKLIPIKYVDKENIILYGFPKEPYEINYPVIE